LGPLNRMSRTLQNSQIPSLYILFSTILYLLSIQIPLSLTAYVPATPALTLVYTLAPRTSLSPSHTLSSSMKMKQKIIHSLSSSSKLACSEQCVRGLGVIRLVTTARILTRQSKEKKKIKPPFSVSSLSRALSLQARLDDIV
jgi:hypothetical protein